MFPIYFSPSSIPLVVLPRIQPSDVCPSSHAISFCLPYLRGIQTLAPDVSTKDNGEMFLVIHIILIDMEPHLRPSDVIRNPRANGTPHIRETIEELRFPGAAAA